MSDIKVIKANWPAPDNVVAFTTTRAGGFSIAPFDTLNLASHVGDDSSRVERNRSALKKSLSLPSEPFWLNQTHSTRVFNWQSTKLNTACDASFTAQPNQVCAVLTADCLPIVITNKQGNWVSAIHAGWRGLADGVVLEAIGKYQGHFSDLLAWVGPSITKAYFEVGDDVLKSFTHKHPQFIRYFDPIVHSLHDKGLEPKYLADIPAIAAHQMKELGVQVTLSGRCSYKESQHFYSYRREQITGRMATLIWFQNKE